MDDRTAAAAPDPILTLGAVALRDRLAAGEVSAVSVVRACLAQIANREHEIQAWAWLDGDHALQQAERLDALRKSGRPIGPLHGLPVGVKDIIDTADMPTANGAALDEGRQPQEDSFVVERLKSAGAVIMGKTVTTELAYMHPGKTRNPHDTAHTPGGSSQGSAAAVAAAMVPLAVGTQTAGSVIRPAAFCGVTGFKPTFGSIPRRGVLAQAPSLDTVGVFARGPQDAALLADSLYGYDAADTATRPIPMPRLLRTAQGSPPAPPVFAMIRPPGWDDADPDLHAAFDELAETLGERAFTFTLPAPFDGAETARSRIQLAEMARCLHAYANEAPDRLGPETRTAIERGNTILARDYLSALDWREVLYSGLEQIFERCNAILCPAAPGPAPRDLSTTGDPVFNGLWTFCGTPSVTLPLLTAQNGLPMGVQLVGPRGEDARLMRTATWLFDWIGA